MSGVHSFLAPSSADVWVYCAGAPLLSSMYPEQETLDTQEGEASHWGVSSVLESYLPDAVDALAMPASFISVEAPNGIIISEEMMDCATVMIEDVLHVCQEFGLLSNLHIEERMTIASIHELNGGTPDVWAYDDQTRTIHLWDYKYGHKDVLADSWQNKNYLAGIIDRLDIDGHYDQQTNVVMKIVQPRSYHSDGPIKEHRCMASDLRADFNLLRSQAAKAVTSEPGVISGAHCRYCPARHTCPAAMSAAASAVDCAMSAVPADLTDDGLSFELALLDRGSKAIEHRYAAIKEEAIRRIEKGASILGYGTEPGLGNRKFNSATDEIKLIGDGLGIEMVVPEKLITPAQFDKALVAVNKERKAAGEEAIDKTVMNAYIDRPTTGIKLVPANETLAVKSFRRLSNDND